jgi:hypothetical protein
METLLFTILASLGVTSVWFLTQPHHLPTRFHRMAVPASASVIARHMRNGTTPGRELCQYCGMNEASHRPQLCTYCYWNLPGSRVQEYFSQP